MDSETIPVHRVAFVVGNILADAVALYADAQHCTDPAPCRSAARDLLLGAAALIRLVSPGLSRPPLSALSTHAVRTIGRAIADALRAHGERAHLTAAGCARRANIAAEEWHAALLAVRPEGL